MKLFRITLTLSMLCLLTVLAGESFAAKPETKAASANSLTIDSSVDRPVLVLGDSVIYTITVRHDPKISLITPWSVPVQPPFAVKKTENFKRQEDGKTVEGKRLTLTAFGVGDFILDSAQIRYQNPDGRLTTQSSPKIYLSIVGSQKNAAGQDIRPIKGVISIIFRYAKVLLHGSLAILLILLAILLIVRKIKKGAVLELKPREMLSPEDEALRGLHTLFDSTLLRQGKFREYFFSLSEIMRFYFEKRFLIFACESTTDELIHQLKQKEVSPELISKIKDLLEAADLAKFAKWKPDPSEVLRLNQRAEDIIHKSTERT